MSTKHPLQVIDRNPNDFPVYLSDSVLIHCWFSVDLFVSVPMLCDSVQVAQQVVQLVFLDVVSPGNLDLLVRLALDVDDPDHVLQELNEDEMMKMMLMLMQMCLLMLMVLVQLLKYKEIRLRKRESFNSW